MDEPETHFNPDWRSRFVSLLNKSLSNKSREQQIILTSHSPFIVSDCREDNVFIFEKSSTGEVRCYHPEFTTFGSSVNLITMKVFGKKETISELSNEHINKIRNMLATGEITSDQAIESAGQLGDSLERTLLLDFIRRASN